MKRFMSILSLLIAFTTSEAVAAAIEFEERNPAYSTPAYNIQRFLEQSDDLLAGTSPVTALKIVDEAENFNTPFWLVLSRFAPSLKSLHLEATSAGEVDLTPALLIPFVELDAFFKVINGCFTPSPASSKATFKESSIRCIGTLTVDRYPEMLGLTGDPRYLPIDSGHVIIDGTFFPPPEMHGATLISSHTGESLGLGSVSISYPSATAAIAPIHSVSHSGISESAIAGIHDVTTTTLASAIAGAHAAGAQQACTAVDTSVSSVSATAGAGAPPPARWEITALDPEYTPPTGVGSFVFCGGGCASSMIIPDANAAPAAAPAPSSDTELTEEGK